MHLILPRTDRCYCSERRCEFGLTTIVNVALCTLSCCWCKGIGVVAVLSSAGDQVPVIPLLDVAGNAFNIARTDRCYCVNVGVIFGLTVIVNVAVVAHCPAVGVKV
jgi:hypothetical protein